MRTLHKIRRPLLLCLCVAAITASASAQRFEFGVFGGQRKMGKAFLGTTRDSSVGQDGDTRFLAKAPTSGVRLTFNTKGYFGHEFTIGVARPTVKALVTDVDGNHVFRQAKSTLGSASYNILAYMMPTGEWWRPYLTVGVQAVRYNRPRIDEWTTGTSGNMGFNYGGGIKFRLFKNGLIRFDARHVATGKPYDLLFPQNIQLTGGLVHMLEASAGASVTF